MSDSTKPDATSISVDLPHPFRPTTHSLSLSVTDKFTFSTDTEKLIDQLEKNAEEEHYDVLLESNLANLRTILQKDKIRELREHKTAILRELQIEIVKRYHYRSGAIANTMALDQDLEKAISLLKDDKTYTNTLKGK